MLLQLGSLSFIDVEKAYGQGSISQSCPTQARSLHLVKHLNRSSPPTGLSNRHPWKVRFCKTPSGGCALDTHSETPGHGLAACLRQRSPLHTQHPFQLHTQINLPCPNSAHSSLTSAETETMKLWLMSGCSCGDSTGDGRPWETHARHESPSRTSPAHGSPPRLLKPSPWFVLVTLPSVNQERDFQEGLLYAKLIIRLSKSTTLRGA